MIEHIATPVSFACRPALPLGAGSGTEFDDVMSPTSREILRRDQPCVPQHRELSAPCRRLRRRCTESETLLEWPGKALTR